MSSIYCCRWAGLLVIAALRAAITLHIILLHIVLVVGLLCYSVAFFIIAALRAAITLRILVRPF